MGLWQQPHFKREPRSVRRKRDEVIVLANHSLAGFALLSDNIAENAALLLIVVVPTAVHFFAYSARYNRQRDQLRVGVLHRRARAFSVILENQHVAEPLVVLQIQHPVAIRPQYILQRALRQRSQRRRVIRRFDDHFMRADSVHLVEQPLALFIEFAFDPQRRKFVWHHSNGPSRSVRTTAVSPVHQHLIRSLPFVPRTEWTIFRILLHHAFAQEIHRPLASLGRNNHPAACNRVF